MAHNVQLETQVLFNGYFWAAILAHLNKSDIPIAEIAEEMVARSSEAHDVYLGNAEEASVCFEGALRESLRSASAFINVNQPPLLPGTWVCVNDPRVCSVDIWASAFEGEIVSVAGIRDYQYVYVVRDGDGKAFHVGAKQLSPRHVM